MESLPPQKLSDFEITKESYVMDAYDISKELSPDHISAVLDGDFDYVLRYLNPEHIGAIRPKLASIFNDTQKLDQLDFFPMNIDNSKLPLLNFFISSAFWRGTRNRARQKDSFFNAITPRNDTQSDFLKTLFNALWSSDPIDTIPMEPSGRRRLVYPQALGRFAGVMGLPLGKKKYANVSIPSYLNLANASLGAENISLEEGDVSAQLLKDFIYPLIFFRFFKYSAEVDYFNLHCFSSYDKAVDQASLLEKIANNAFGSDFNFASRCYESKSGYVGRLFLRIEKDLSLEKLKIASRDRLEEIIGELHS